MKAYLTFDDGPEPGTKDVLEVLAAKGVKATFFLTGKNSDTLPGGKADQKSLVEQIILDGHTLGNHCLSHTIQTKDQYTKAYGNLETEAQRTAFLANFADNKKYFDDLISPKKVSFTHGRLPGDGRFFPHLVTFVQDNVKLTHHGWTFEFAPNGVFSWVPKNDWQGIEGVAASETVMPNDKAVILLHDRHWKGSNRPKFEKLVDKLKSKFELLPL